MSDCKETVDKLNGKIREYEGLLEELLSGAKELGIISGGPEKEGNKTYYRVSKGDSSILLSYDKSLLFPNGVKELGLETEVICSGGLIVGIVPDKLRQLKEQTQFELIDWNAIGGLKSQMDRIREAVELPLNNEKLFKEYGLSPVKGLLLTGPPGCGKTLIAKAIASTVLKANKVDIEAFTYVKGAELLHWYVGRTEHSIRAIFEGARNYTKKTGKRAVVFIDEAEALLPARGSRRSSDVDKTIVPTFLSEMDGFEGHNPLMILSTNLPDSLDPAIIRPGRIDLKILIDRPNQEDSKEIFNIHLRNVKCGDSITKLSEMGADGIFGCSIKAGVSGALIENIVKNAAHKALTRKLKDNKAKAGVLTIDLLESINQLHDESRVTEAA